MFESIFIVFFSLGVYMIVESYDKWKKLSKGVYIDDLIVKKRKRYRYIAVWGILFIFASIRFLLHHYLWQIQMAPNVISLLVVGILFGYFRCYIEPYYNASAAKSIEHLCLYLRPFDTDSHNVISNRSEFVSGDIGWIPQKIERIICKELNKKIIQTFAIGNPNTNIPIMLSTSNIYANDSEWKDTIVELAKKAGVIIVKVGDTEGCQWEINHCITHEYLNKTLFLVCGKPSLAILQKKIPDIGPIASTIEDNSTFALFRSEITDEWNAESLVTKADVNRCLKDYLKKHPSLNHLYEIQSNKKINVWNVLKAKKIPARWWQVLSAGTNPFAYCLLNKWPKRWILALLGSFVTYFILVIVSDLCLFRYMDRSVVILINSAIFLLLFLPWMWIAPKISWTNRVWPSKEIFFQNNKSLFFWMWAFAACNMLIYLPLLCLITLSH